MTNITRPDFAAIAAWVTPGAKVLDLGCGDGSLLRYLRETRQVRGYGIEIAEDNLAACIKNGINVIQMDLESGLSGFEPQSFDFVILSQTLQAMKNIELMMSEMLRVGKQSIVTLPNFGFWQHRLQILSGHMPVSPDLPYQWYDTPNIHLCTFGDFEAFCRDQGVAVRERIAMHNAQVVTFLPKLFGSLAVYRLERAAKTA
ncbi:MAG: methionine biosynthesis protein MetW [Sulfuricella sp.]|nr:methionine biosynthesis protein MetW [Sulfuricella sp.]